MTLPTILFGFISAILVGSGFHLWRGGSFGKLILYLIVSIVGFWLSQLIAMLLQLKFLSIGALEFGINIVGSIGLLFLTYLLTNNPEETETKSKRRGK
ncbi:MAG: hypothetical protein JEZ00_00100 [Anaerolineaceae bacterium]|nr:hypothetical protein [Anaerolineaceae bacterium]